MEGTESLRERTLIERFRSGDEDAFGDLVRPWHRCLAGYLGRMCGDPGQADDLLQETLFRAWRGLASYDERKRFASWLFTIAHHVTIDHLRRHVREPPRVFDTVEMPSPADPSRELMARELGRILANAVETLPEKQRRVFLLRQHGGLKFREIAELTGEPLSTVLGHMSYATEKLQRIVRQYHAGR
jgi:RNA polymerase sigma-70 factor (ECF subfamily)